ncbi:IucA/IucC family protein [Streptomyces orinoci]|uniref:IucA/IucC family protein n=1 Tax=Streptomyces orinoci TaxID=67339 RepID=A0ABV3K2G4_STRON|nr:IucA/IucC family protein [Streptomyces orinoci]
MKAPGALAAVARQAGFPGPRPPADPLDHPDPARAADATVLERLLRCWVRETNVARPGGSCLRIPLSADGRVLHVPVPYWSVTGSHRFGPPGLLDGPADAPALDAVTLAALLGREAVHSGRAPAGHGAELTLRIAELVRRTTAFLRQRRLDPGPEDGEYFLHGEQALPGAALGETEGHPPESAEPFRLHWLGVHRSLLAADSAWTERGRIVGAAVLTARLAPPALGLPADSVPLPVHPARLAALHREPAVVRLLEAGLLHDLGAHGQPWYATTAPRTVYRSGAPALLRLNESDRQLLASGVELHRMLRGGIAQRWHAACGPGFDVIRDPAWLGVNAPDGVPVPGLGLGIRHHPFAPDADAVCLAGLLAPRPWPGRTTPAGHPALCSRLAAIVARLVRRTGRPAGAVSAEWFLRYLEAVVRPLLWLDGAAGIVLGADRQHTLVLLDAEGWPAGGRHRGSLHHRLRERLHPPGPATVADDRADEEFACALGIDNLLGLIGALGAQRLADERILLAALRRFLREAAGAPAGTRSSLPGMLLDSPTLRCRAGLLTGPVTITNPLATAPG